MLHGSNVFIAVPNEILEWQDVMRLDMFEWKIIWQCLNLSSFVDFFFQSLIKHNKLSQLEYLSKLKYKVYENEHISGMAYLCTCTVTVASEYYTDNTGDCYNIMILASLLLHMLHHILPTSLQNIENSLANKDMHW